LKRAQVLAGAQCIEIRGRAAAGLGFALVLVAERAAAEGPASVERMFTAPLRDIGCSPAFSAAPGSRGDGPSTTSDSSCWLRRPWSFLASGMPWFNGTRSMAASDVVPLRQTDAWRDFMHWLAAVLT
jgi:hypothetical protein